MADAEPILDDIDAIVREMQQPGALADPMGTVTWCLELHDLLGELIAEMRRQPLDEHYNVTYVRAMAMLVQDRARDGVRRLWNAPFDVKLRVEFGSVLYGEAAAVTAEYRKRFPTEGAPLN